MAKVPAKKADDDFIAKARGIPISFRRVEGATVVLLKSGVYKTTDVYRSGDTLYAKHSGGFVKLRSHYATSVPSLSWDTLDVDFEIRVGGLGAIMAVE